MKPESRFGQHNLPLMASKKTNGIIFALIAAFVSGVSILTNKFAVDVIKQPLIFTTVKNTGVALILLVILFRSGKLKQIASLSKKQKILLTLIGIVGGSIPFYLFFTGLSMIPSINGAIIHKTLVFWVAILALPFLKEKLSKQAILAIILLFEANVLVGGFAGFSYSRGELFVLLATILWAIETIISKKVLPNIDPDIVVQARMGIGAIILLVISFLTKPQELLAVSSLSPDKWMWVAITTIFLFAYVRTFYRGLKHAPATTVSAILVGSTLITNVLSAIFITHTFNLLLSVQSALIIFGLYALLRLEATPKVAVE